MLPHVVRIESGDYAAEVSSIGGGLRMCTYRDQPLVESYPRGEKPPLNSNVVLAPWPNRTEDGCFSFEGVDYNLEVSEPDRNNAIHGLVASLPWSLTQISAEHAAASCSIGPQPGWPWAFSLRSDYVLSAEGLKVVFKARNDAAAPAPFAFGVHTYLSLFGRPIDECVLSVPGQTLLELDPTRLLPTGVEQPLDQVSELRELASGIKLSGAVLDHCVRGDYGHVPRVCVLKHADLATEPRSIVMTTDIKLPWFQIFTADPELGCGYPDRGRALAVEPMSAPPNALRSGRDLAVVNPKEHVVFEWSLRVGA